MVKQSRSGIRRGLQRCLVSILIAGNAANIGLGLGSIAKSVATDHQIKQAKIQEIKGEKMGIYQAVQRRWNRESRYDKLHGYGLICLGSLGLHLAYYMSKEEE